MGVGAVVVLVGGAALALPLAVRLVLGLAALVVLVVIAKTRFARRSRAAATPSGAAVESDARGLTRIQEDGGRRSPLVEWDAPFGVTLLASYGRPVGLLAFTTRTQTRYLPARIDQPSDDDDGLLAQIAVLADLDLLDGVGHEAALTSAATAALVREVRAHDETALGKIYMSDGKGLAISLDRATLVVGAACFDLTSRIEWRPLMFHESTGHAAALYQATWIRQGSAEVVLVAPMPASLVPRDVATRDAQGRLGQALTRYVRLLHVPADNPPPRDARIAIDRPFMLAVRRALDDAPHAARIVPDPIHKPRKEARRTLP